MTGELSRRTVLKGAAAASLIGGTVGFGTSAHAATTSPAADGLARKLSVIGTPVSRIDGRAKVTGEAKYAAEFQAPDLAYGSMVTSTIARGRIAAIDAAEALRVPGVLDVLTHANRPAMADRDEAYHDDAAPDGSPFRPLFDDRVLFNGQPVAVVLAEDIETARFAASLVKIEYAAETPATDLEAERSHAVVVEKPWKGRGDAASAFASAPVKLEAEYFIPMEHHNPMELYAATAVWESDGNLTVYDKTQGVQNVQRYLCGVFALEPEQVRVVAPYVGGAFGSGLRPQFEVVLAAQGALKLKRSVRVVLTRAQMYGLGYRPATIERLSLGAKHDGTLDAVTHEAIAMTSRFEQFSRHDTSWSGLLYKSATARYVHRLAALDLPTSCDMRAPGAATGVYALECAMDELAVALKMDPLELRLRCYSERDQNDDIPYTSKRLRECYHQAAQRFGWERRSAAPRSMRDGHELIGWGMASGIWEALQIKHTARITLAADGGAEVACATMDIGTGTYTVMAQVAAEMLGLPVERITVKLGDSSLPQAQIEGGSWGAASVSHAILRAATELRGALLTLAQATPNSPLAGLRAEETILADGRLVALQDPARAVATADLLHQAGLPTISKEAESGFEPDDRHAHNTHAAIFAEVRVDEELAIVRVTRVVSAVAAGRIINPKTAHSQIMGGIVWGIGMALHEETLIDHRFGRVMNANIAEYHIPAHADVRNIDAFFVDELDTVINPLGVKGVGEIGLVGVAAAIANAVYHATGKRIRDLPITLDKVLLRDRA
ncbi:xanthine dehydrogenase family protein molybdopterin-binding subunit [Hypericibacter adhaerens]|nr:xanthine dehydrogenase family protein molybdopterin-binding subunit [Hypericibacter adhaerens]